jgi:hypothetical protein
MVFSASFKNVSVISLRSVLLMEETSYIVTVSFIDEGKRSIQRNPPTGYKSLRSRISFLLWTNIETVIQT